MTETVRLTIPKEELYHGVARLVVGGLAARLEFSYEYLEDVQLALESFLANEAYAASETITIELGVREDGIQLRVGPVADLLRSDLERDVSEDEGVGLGRLLETVAEGVAVETTDGTQWLRLEKRLPGRAVSGA